MRCFCRYQTALLKGQKANEKREELFVGIDDYSRELYAAIMPGKTALIAARFLTGQVIDLCADTIEYIYSDNGTKYKGMKQHEFKLACHRNDISQKFTRPAHPQSNIKAERVIRP